MNGKNQKVFEYFNIKNYLILNHKLFNIKIINYLI